MRTRVNGASKLVSPHYIQSPPQGSIDQASLSVPIPYDPSQPPDENPAILSGIVSPVSGTGTGTGTLLNTHFKN